MFISIVVPTRNRVALLTRALQAIRSQTYPHYEVLVVDDGSDAQTRALYPALCAELGDRFRLLHVGTDGQRGQGPSASRNMGISQAQGELLAFCDDDDLWIDPAHLAAVSRLFETQAGVDLCISNQRAVFVDGKVREHWLPALSNRINALPRLDDRFSVVSMAELCQSGGFAHLNMLCVRRQVVTAVDGFWEAVNYEEDRDFFWRCADVCRGLAYTATTVAQHHVPDPARRVNVSSAIQQQERWLVAALVSRHIAISVKSPVVARLFLHHEGDLLRRLALHCAEHHQPSASLLLARQALGARFSIKWAIYCVWAWAKSLKPW
ncbi:glycosyltransferase family 2 protein [Rhodoferax sp. BLA1]|uniref:glycosyltransferase family 2 protein n=1 Tax=Rhodoferax sp. BLA1 TaxID=2576062 RepID=UPI0015D2F84C|nr:glycosyltransferase family 2 protein [Rhodoferax sp. BLA1]